MLQVKNVKLPLEQTEEIIKTAIADTIEVDVTMIISFKIVKSTYDARKTDFITFLNTYLVEVENETNLLLAHADNIDIIAAPDTEYKNITKAQPEIDNRPVIIGTGPAGIFAGLILAQMGVKPILLERGKIVRERTVDTFSFWRDRKFNADSNVQFGEGGAGTFSDGKLYSQIKDKHNRIHKIKQEFRV